MINCLQVLFILTASSLQNKLASINPLLIHVVLQNIAKIKRIISSSVNSNLSRVDFIPIKFLFLREYSIRNLDNSLGRFLVENSVNNFKHERLNIYHLLCLIFWSIFRMNVNYCQSCLALTGIGLSDIIFRPFLWRILETKLLLLFFFMNERFLFMTCEILKIKRICASSLTKVYMGLT